MNLPTPELKVAVGSAQAKALRTEGSGLGFRVPGLGFGVYDLRTEGFG